MLAESGSCIAIIAFALEPCWEVAKLTGFLTYEIESKITP